MPTYVVRGIAAIRFRSASGHPTACRLKNSTSISCPSALLVSRSPTTSPCLPSYLFLPAGQLQQVARTRNESFDTGFPAGSQSFCMKDDANTQRALCNSSSSLPSNVTGERRADTGPLRFELGDEGYLYRCRVPRRGIILRANSAAFRKQWERERWREILRGKVGLKRERERGQVSEGRMREPN